MPACLHRTNGNKKALLDLCGSVKTAKHCSRQYCSGICEGELPLGWGGN